MATTFETLNWSVQLDPGTPDDITAIVLSVDVSHGTEQQNSSATIVCTEYPDSFDFRQPIYIYASLSGGTPPIIFNGECIGIKSNHAGQYTITATDYLARLKFPWSKDTRTYTSDDASAVKQNLVEASGIDVSLTDIQAPAGWTIGVGEDVLLEPGDTPLELIQAIDDAMPYWRTWTRPNGAIRSRPIEIGTSVATFTRGVAPVVEMEWEDTIEGIVNACKVIGAVYNDVPVEAIYQQTTSYIPDPPKYVTETFQSRLIEDPTQALVVATARVGFTNTLQARGRVLTTLREDIEPGDTITLDDPSGYVNVSNTKAWVTSVRHSIPACTTEISTGLIYE